MTDNEQLLTEAHLCYLSLSKAWHLARIFDEESAERLERLADRAWERMLRRGKTVDAIRMQELLS